VQEECSNFSRKRIYVLNRDDRYLISIQTFVDPRQAFGPEKIIPPQILAKAQVGSFFLAYSKGCARAVRLIDHHRRVSPCSQSSKLASSDQVDSAPV